MNQNKTKERIQLVYSLKKEIIRQIHKNYEINKLKAMGELAKENQTKTNSQHSYFMFEGLWYTYPYNAQMPRNTEGIKRSLDISLIPKAIDITCTKYFEENIAITNLVNNALFICRTADCLQKLLPYIDYQKIELSKLTDIYNIGEPLLPGEIELFHLKNQKGLTAIKSLYMRELLLSGDNTNG